MIATRRYVKKRVGIKVRGTLHAALDAMIVHGFTKFSDLRSSPACARNLQLLLMYGLIDRKTLPAKNPGISAKRILNRIKRLEKADKDFAQEVKLFRRKRKEWQRSLDHVLGVGAAPMKPVNPLIDTYIPTPSKLRRGVNKVMYVVTDAGRQVYGQLQWCKSYYLAVDVPLSKKWCKYFSNHVW